MTNKEKALAYIKQMRLIDMDSQEFTNDMVWMSVQDNDQARSGAMFRLDDNVRRKINELEQSGSIVWHIIQGTYRFWNEPEIGTATDKGSETTEGETPAPVPLPYTDIRFTTYLLATDEDGDTLAEYDAKQFYAFAWVENEDIPELSEYGTVIIERCNGGLWRVC
jgi:hypothetical protein